MDLLSYITGNKPNDGQATGPAFIDRFINPMTMAGLAMIGDKDPMAAANFADQMQQRRQTRQMASFLVANAPQEEKAMALLAPSQYVAAKMGRMMQKPMVVGENDTVYDPSNNQWITPPSGGPTQQWTPDKMRKEYDYSKYTPDSVKAAEEARDPSLLAFDPSSPAIQKDKIQVFNTARQDIEKQLTPIRAGMQGIQAAKSLLSVEGGAADYGAIVGYVKALDPTSVAREGEVDSATRAAGYISTINSIAERMKATGGVMGAEQKAQLNEAINGLSGMFERKYQDVADYAAGYNKEFGLDTNMILGPKLNFPGSGYKKTEQSSIVDEAPDFAKRAKEAVLGKDEPPAPKIEAMVQPKKGGGFEYSYDGGKTWGGRR
jgi:hypothetical protein